MPYIKQERREKLSPKEGLVCEDFTQTSGELNYVITTAVLMHIGPSPNYEQINAAIGALECAKLELYRRIAAPYEDKKCKENGDVY